MSVLWRKNPTPIQTLSYSHPQMMSRPASCLRQLTLRNLLSLTALGYPSSNIQIKNKRFLWHFKMLFFKQSQFLFFAFSPEIVDLLLFWRSFHFFNLFGNFFFYFFIVFEVKCRLFIWLQKTPSNAGLEKSLRNDVWCQKLNERHLTPRHWWSWQFCSLRLCATALSIMLRF
jgi:hypothetical protein